MQKAWDSRVSNSFSIYSVFCHTLEQVQKYIDNYGPLSSRGPRIGKNRPISTGMALPKHSPPLSTLNMLDTTQNVLYRLSILNPKYSTPSKASYVGAFWLFIQVIFFPHQTSGSIHHILRHKNWNQFLPSDTAEKWSKHCLGQSRAEKKSF